MSNNPYKRTSKVDVIGDLPGADQARNLLRIGHVAQDVTLETRLYEAVNSNGDPSVRVEPTSGSFDVEQADPVALEGDDGAGTYGEVYRRGNALRASLEADEVGLATESSLTSEQAREVATWSAGTLAVEQQTPVGVEDSGGTQVDPATEGSLTSEQAREVATWSAGTLPVEQQTPVGVEDSSGGQVDPATEGTLASRLTRELEADDGSGTYAPIHRNANALTAAIVEWSAGTLLVQEDTPLDVSASTVSIQEDTALDVSGATVPVEQQTPVAVEDSAGTQIDPSIKPEYINYQAAGHDTVGAGDLTIGPRRVNRGTAVIIAATSTDDNAFSVSVEWVDSSGNTYQSESAADIGMNSITEDYARLVRKGPQAEVIATDESGAAQNLVNVHVDTER
jgi:hypothetical protein